jgi:hypothetical protein
MQRVVYKWVFGRAVMLVLIAMQKLASSSVAAIRRAFKGRLDRIRRGRKELDELRHRRDTESILHARDYRHAEDEGDAPAN